MRNEGDTKARDEPAARHEARRAPSVFVSCAFHAPLGDTADPGLPPAQGLYDPRARQGLLRRRLHRRHQGPQVAQAGRGRARHPLQSRAPRRGRRRSARRRRRRHPGADPARVLRARRPTSSASSCPRPANTRSASCSCRPIRTGGRSSATSMRRRSSARACTLLGWRDVPTDNSTLGESVKPTEPVHQQVFIGRGKKIKDEDEFERRLYILRKAISSADLCAARAPAVELLPGVDLLPHRRLQGHVPGRPARHLLPGPARPGFRERARAGAPALLDQHVPDLVARASLPDDRPQRRDQHAARQQQLDGGAAGVGVVAAVRRRHQQALADLLRRPVRHRLLRQRARIPGAGRLPARARDDDDDPRGLGGQSAHGRGAARFLRIQRRADGAVGRPGRDRLHQRPPDRRHARPQRPAPRALLRHPRRPHHHGLRDGRAADPGEGHRHQVAAAARQDAAGRSRRGPAHSRRGAQGHARQEPSLSGVARAARRSFWKTCRRRPTKATHLQPVAARSPAGLRLHPGRPASS